MTFHAFIARKSFLMVAALVALLLPAGATEAQDFQHHNSLVAQLSPLEQVPSALAKSRGRFEAEINEDGTLTFTMSYSDMSSPVTQAHIHFGAGKTNGGVIVFLCGGSKPACPASGTVTGTLTSADISVLPASNSDSVIPQGIQPGDFNALIDAIRSGNTYVNVHSQTFPSGEIRGQVLVR